MDESEFVVVNEEHKESVEFDNLAEVVQAYGAARESLLKGVTLLHDTLNLNMELALKNTPPDFESNSDDLMRRVLGSLHTSSEAVLRNHVKSLCSKLVAVKKEYEDLANKFESLNTQGSPESSAKLVHLAGVFDQIDALLPPSGDASTVGPSKTAPTADVEELCTRAEIIRDRVKLVMEARPGSTSDLGQPEQRDRPDLESNTSSPKAESNMDYFFSPHLPSLNLIRKTSSEVSLYHSQYPQHAIPPSHYYHRLQQYQQYRHQSHHVDCEQQSHQLPLRPAATATTVTYRHDPHIVSSARHSLVIDDDLRLPVGHVQRLKKKLSASLTASGSDHVPSDLRAIPRQIPGAKELFGASTSPSKPTILSSSGAKPSSLPTQRRLPPLSPRRQSTKDEIVSLQKNVASLAAAAALQRNVSVRAKEVIIDGCGGSGGKGGIKVSGRDLAVSRSVAVGFVPPLLPKPSISVQTQTEPFGACPWWMMLEAPGWRQSSMSSATSSGIGMDDGSNFQDDFSSVSKTCFVCCKHSAVMVGAGATNRPQSGSNSFYPAPDLLQEVAQANDQSKLSHLLELIQSISRMIREEVTSVFQSEMGNIMERQRDLIQQVLKPLTEGKRKEDHAQFPADGFLESTEGDKSHSASFSPKPSTTSPSYLGPYANEDVVVVEVREKSTQPPLQNPGDASSSVTQPMLLPVPHRLVKRFVPPVPIVCPQLLPSGLMSSSQSQPGPSRRQKPSFLPDDETPVCPKCQIWLPDRDALEIHLDTCLQ